jgi:acyl-CoA synthetase (AMP-forming)/AMP-acid ligase II
VHPDIEDIDYYNQRQLILGELIARRARIHPGREALVFAGRRWTYLELDNRANRVANALIAGGVGQGGHIAQLLMNCSECIEIDFAVAKMGAVSVPVNFRLKAPEILYQLRDSESEVLFFGEEMAAAVEEVRAELPHLRYICVGATRPEYALAYEEFLAASSQEPPLVPVSDDDPAFIMYTSGTTGSPKGAVITHKNLMINVMNGIMEWYPGLGEYPDEKWLCVAPLFHIGALWVTMICLFRGGTACIMKAFDPLETVRQFQEEKITNIFMPPVMSTFILNSVDLSQYDTSSLRFIGSGASVLPSETRRQINEAFPDVWLVDGLGMTEMTPFCCCLKPQDALRKVASVGLPVVNVEVRVVDDNDEDVPVGEPGEIVYRGPTTMKEYYKNPHATAEALRGGWFHSGDIVRRDEEGFIYIVDRKKDMIVSGGENVYPAEVEEVLYQNPKVLEAAVIGVHDEVWGEAVMAVVVPKPGVELTEQEVIDWCAERLAGYKKPKHVDLVEALPRNAAMKVLKTELRERYGKALRYD